MKNAKSHFEQAMSSLINFRAAKRFIVYPTIQTDN